MNLSPFCYDSQFTFLDRNDELFEKFRVNVLGNKGIKHVEYPKLYLKDEDWDTAYFGQKTGRIIWMENHQIDQKAYDSIMRCTLDYSCCYFRTNALHPFNEQAQIHSLKPLSVKHSQYIDLRELENSKKDNIDCHQLLTKDVENDPIGRQILEMSKGSFRHNRFRNDPHFREDSIDNLYRNWIINEVNSGKGELYYISEHASIGAFLLYRDNISPLEDVKIGFVSLVASSPAYKGKGYASALLRNILRKKKQDTAYVIANTEQQNIHGLRFFESNGFKVSATINEYHIWN